MKRCILLDAILYPEGSNKDLISQNEAKNCIIRFCYILIIVDEKTMYHLQVSEDRDSSVDREDLLYPWLIQEYLMGVIENRYIEGWVKEENEEERTNEIEGW
jgi:hypothetical protein